MSFPSVVELNFGDEKVTSTAKINGLPLGIIGRLPDGRLFRHSRNGGTALVAGNLYQGKAAEANTIFNTTPFIAPAATATVGATTVVLTIGGTALVADVYADGYLYTASSIGTGIGYNYKVKSNNSCAIAGTTTVILYENDKIAVEIAGATTRVAMRKNEFDSVLLTTGNTVGVNTLAGVACATAAASAYCWLQRKGPAPCFTDNTTLVVGMDIIASTTVGGAVGPAVVTGTTLGTTGSQKSVFPIGLCMAVSGSAEFALIDLKLD